MLSNDKRNFDGQVRFCPPEPLKWSGMSSSIRKRSTYLPFDHYMNKLLSLNSIIGEPFCWKQGTFFIYRVASWTYRVFSNCARLNSFISLIEDTTAYEMKTNWAFFRSKLFQGICIRPVVLNLWWTPKTQKKFTFVIFMEPLDPLHGPPAKNLCIRWKIQFCRYR